ncbi:hypothetical protein QUF63_08875 [Anaerolineales bacterium HSG25]|nr:hypothetical protein [Anaerolineales bacterium HSG25]
MNRIVESYGLPTQGATKHIGINPDADSQSRLKPAKAVPTFKTSQKSLAELVEASSPSTGSGDGGRFIFLELPK